MVPRIVTLENPVKDHQFLKSSNSDKPSAVKYDDQLSLENCERKIVLWQQFSLYGYLKN